MLSNELFSLDYLYHCVCNNQFLEITFADVGYIAGAAVRKWNETSTN